MPIESPQLDDLQYDRVVEELKRRIPVYSPEWTDFNDSDPGITLIQLFGYLAEQVGYRLNRVPEKNQIELLKLLGVRLKPAHAATTRLALLLTDPTTLLGYTLPAGANARAKKGTPPVLFETDADVDVVPAEPVAVLATRNPDLRDLLLRQGGGTDTFPPNPPSAPKAVAKWLSVVWDGKLPKLKDMPLGPVTLTATAGQRYLWVGVNYNDALDAGFLGVGVSLTIQLDDDEQPSFTAQETCTPPAPAGESPAPVDWLWYYDARSHRFQHVRGRIDDSTARLTRSGTLQFTVPLSLGPIPAGEFKDLVPAPGAPSALGACTDLANALKDKLPKVDTTIPDPAARIQDWIKRYPDGLSAAVQEAVQQATPAAGKPVPHPLDAGLRATKGWLRIGLLPAAQGPPVGTKLRIATFNAVAVTHASTVNGELLGTADGTPGQTYSLKNQNVQKGTLSLAVQESPDDEGAPLVTWAEVDSLDGAGAFDSAYVLDPEAGTVTFGDGFHGRIPPLVPQGGRVVALTYRWGGGAAGNVAVGDVAKMDTPADGVGDVVNFVKAQGGLDAETLPDAEIRARKELSTRSRAVTAGDFEWIATQTPGVQVARARVVPLRVPLGPDSTVAAVADKQCGAAVPKTPAGLAAFTAYGAVSVIVVPGGGGPEPTPTPSFLRAVCTWLNDYRLVTTEVHVVPPQYARLCNVRVSVKPGPGYTRATLQAGVSARLAAYLHVLSGGDDGAGFPFGGQLHVADLMAQVFRTEGVERVESVTADFVRTKSDAGPREGTLALCPASPGQTDRIALAPEENVSLNLDSFLLSTVT